MDRDDFGALMNQVIEAHIERGYNPYAQIKGYLLKNDFIYITKYKGARDIMKTLDRAMVLDYINHWDEVQDKKWRINFVQSNF